MTSTSRARARWVSGPRPIASRPSTTSATRLGKSAVHQVKDAHCLGEQRVVAARLLARALEHGLEPLGVGRRNAADVEKMHRRADHREGGVAVQAEAPGEHLEG